MKLKKIIREFMNTPAVLEPHIYFDSGCTIIMLGDKQIYIHKGLKDYELFEKIKIDNRICIVFNVTTDLGAQKRIVKLKLYKDIKE